MAKYIDAEKLRKEVKGLERAAHKSALGCADSERRKFHEGKDYAYQHVGILIDSLQQEQPEVDLDAIVDEAPKIKGWVARDGDFGHLRLYPSKPWRGANDYEWGSGYPCMQILDDNFLPKVTFENSPIEVELLIRECHE